MPRNALHSFPVGSYHDSSTLLFRLLAIAALTDAPCPSTFLEMRFCLAGTPRTGDVARTEGGAKAWEARSKRVSGDHGKGVGSCGRRQFPRCGRHQPSPHMAVPAIMCARRGMVVARGGGLMLTCRKGEGKDSYVMELGIKHTIFPLSKTSLSSCCDQHLFCYLLTHHDDRYLLRVSCAVSSPRSS